MLYMKLCNALVALQVCIFLLGVAWLQGVFERYHVPTLAAEMRKPYDAHALHSDDDGRAEVVPTLPELPFMPRLVTGGFNQFVEQPPAWFRASPEGEAARWAVELHESDDTKSVWDEFEAWPCQDPEHRRAYVSAERAWRVRQQEAPRRDWGPSR
jgi:hypothetical protein